MKLVWFWPLLTLAQQPYDKLVTPQAITKQGIWKTHLTGGKLYFEIPKQEFGKEYLVTGSMTDVPSGISFSGSSLSRRRIRWERRGSQVFLKAIVSSALEPSGPLALRVRAANSEPIVAAFKVEAEGAESAAVIDVSPLFLSDVAEFSAKRKLSAKGYDATRSYIDHALAFPRNVTVEAVLTYSGLEHEGEDLPSATIRVVYSFLKLPDEPMTPRLADARIGSMGQEFDDFGQDGKRPYKLQYQARWRLDRPLEVWIDPATPLVWRPYVKRAIESWNPAFAQCGRPNAIIARQGPSPEEDPDWSSGDSRHTTVIWQPRPETLAFAGPDIDPRTGEILAATIQFYHGILTRMSANYFVQAAALDPRARRFPLPEDIVGRLIEYVVAHEVGHALGFPHNMKASATYSIANIRDREWVKQNGFAPSILDYSRFNYVAQPEDKMDPADLFPVIGPYDRYALCYAYQTDLGDREAYLRKQEAVPWFRTEMNEIGDPGELTESVGDTDSVTASTLGMKNLKRVLEMLPAATDDNRWLAELYGRAVGQWTNEMTHVAAIVGGADGQELPGRVRFTSVAKARQKDAMRFLAEYAWPTPEFLLHDDVLRRIEPQGALERIGEAHWWMLRTLLDARRLTRLVEYKLYPVDEFLTDLRHGVWASSGDAHRMALQRQYIELISQRLHLAPYATVRPYLRAELKALDRMLAGQTGAHATDARAMIARALDPAFMPVPAKEPEAPLRFPLR